MDQELAAAKVEAATATPKKDKGKAAEVTAPVVLVESAEKIELTELPEEEHLSDEVITLFFHSFMCINDHYLAGEKHSALFVE